MYFHVNDFVLICSCKVVAYLASYPCKWDFLSLLQTFGVNHVKPFSSAIDLNKGKALAGMVTNEYQDNFEDDVIIINRWAEFLGLTGWFRWVDFEDVPAIIWKCFNRRKSHFVATTFYNRKESVF